MEELLLPVVSIVSSAAIVLVTFLAGRRNTLREELDAMRRDRDDARGERDHARAERQRALEQLESCERDLGSTLRENVELARRLARLDEPPDRR